MKKPDLLIFGIDGASPAYIKQAVSEGRLPNFKRLMEKGVFLEDCMTAFPSITPTCWSAICTGAPASVNGALCHEVHKPGTHPEQLYTPYSSDLIRAERFWEAAAKIGKTALLFDVPCSGPAKCGGILQIRGGVSISADLSPEKAYTSGIPQQVFRNDGEMVVVDTLKALAGGAWNSVFGKNKFVCLDENTFVFHPIYTSSNYNPKEVESHIWVIIREKDGIRVGVDEKSAHTAPLLRLGQWTDVITRQLMTEDGERIPFHFRARLDAYDTETGIFTVFVTGAENPLKEITPLSLARELAEIPEVTRSIDHASIYNPPYAADKYIEGEGFEIQWNQQVLKHCLNKYQPDIVFDYDGSIDSLNHRYRCAYEGYENVWFKCEGEKEIAEKAYRLGYDLMDAHLGWLLEHAADENTTVMVVSDHGAVGYNERVRPWDIMVAEGLVVYKEGVDPLTANGNGVDWTKTKVYPVGSCYVNVNLKGREPTGIVDPADYDKTVAEIITALQKHERSRDGSTIALAFAVEKRSAGFVGVGGENCGDVVYGITGSRMGGFIGGVHSQQIPSARSDKGDIRSLCIFSGPGIQKNVTLSRPANLTDLAPTLCYAVDYPQPKDATGGVIFQIFENK